VKKVSIDTWIQLLGMLSVVAGLVFVGLEMQQSQKFALAGLQANRVQPQKPILLVSPFGRLNPLVNC